jgi:glucuronate isomerase
MGLGKGWVQQFHIALRNNNSRMLQTLGKIRDEILQTYAGRVTWEILDKLDGTINWQKRSFTI